jgi:hypothetical protein
MEEVVLWYQGLPTPFKVGIWILGLFLVIAIVKRLAKVAIWLTILIILIFVARAVITHF